jgi:muconolactone D-isomerase
MGDEKRPGGEYLARIEVNLAAIPEDKRGELLACELERGQQLFAQGAIRRIWRIPGRMANYSLWVAEDATELHALISSLPLWQWMSVEITALAFHAAEEPPAAS